MKSKRQLADKLIETYLVKDENISDFGFDVRVMALDFELGVFPETAVILQLDPSWHVPVRDARLDLADDMKLLRITFDLRQIK